MTRADPDLLKRSLSPYAVHPQEGEGIKIPVYIVDDERITRQGLRKVIEEMGDPYYVVGEAADGSQGMRAVLRLKPAVTLCDIRMPKMNGIDFAENIRRYDKAAEIIFISGFSDKEYLLSAIRLQAFEYLEKPLDPEKIKQTVESAAQTYLRKIQLHQSSNQQLVRRIFTAATVSVKDVEEFCRYNSIQISTNRRILAGSLQTAETAERQRDLSQFTE